jgi:tRNA G18 (ribose-2'-O)-methylase SpoU
MTETRNINDVYWYWKNDAIKADLNRKRHPFAVLCSNLYNDFNIAGAVRNSNAFLAKKVFIYGKRKFDRRGAVGTYHYENIVHLPDLDALLGILPEYTLVAVDDIEGATAIDDFIWPKNTLMAFGQEQVGLPPEIIERAAHTVYIKQFGSVRSLNVACASGICMYDWCRQNHE